MTSSSIDTRPVLIDELVRTLSRVVGERGIRRDEPTRRRASMDGATMSPILMEQAPLGLADVVVTPTAPDQVPAIVAEAVRLGIPVTTRGRGTGNYGQAIPLRGGMVLDLSRMSRIHGIDDETIAAEAGASMLALESEAWKVGKQLWMYPSTVQSTLGGFLSGGSCGTGSIRHGNNDEGFVRALSLVDARAAPSITRLEGADATPYVHSYGVAGVVVEAEVRVEPLQPWRAVWASFPDVRDALSIFREIRELEPRPRLVSVDDPELVAALPANDGLALGRASLRAVVDAETLDEVVALVAAAGGRVEGIGEGLQAVLALSQISYNHPTWWLMRSRPGYFVHLEAIGDALADRYEEALRVFDESTLHFEAGFAEPFVLVNGRYESRADTYRAMDDLRRLGAQVHNPHEWWVDHELERTRTLAAQADPTGILNPGKLP